MEHNKKIPVFAENAVATSQPLTARAGLEIMWAGGNALDAALATAITLTVVEPTSNGVGGDAFAMIWDGTRLHGINSSGRSPAAWTPDHFAPYRVIIDSADSIHLQVEAMKIAFAEAFQHIADPRSMRIGVGSLLDGDYLASRANQIRMNSIVQPVTAFPPEGGTVYLTAADADGMMVSYIQSNFHGFGSGIVIPGTGISLHNRGRGFSLMPGHPNQVKGGKLPYHTIIPAFVTRNGRSVMSFGVMGAHMQPQGHVQVILRIFEYGLNPQATLDAPRWHVGEDFSLSFEKGISDSVIGDLERRGHRIMPEDPPMGLFGGGQIILKQGKGYCAASDPRKDGQAVGF